VPDQNLIFAPDLKEDEDPDPEQLTALTLSLLFDAFTKLLYLVLNDTRAGLPFTGHIHVSIKNIA
jgi:hypothetical protein